MNTFESIERFLEEFRHLHVNSRVSHDCLAFLIQFLRLIFYNIIKGEDPIEKKNVQESN